MRRFWLAILLAVAIAAGSVANAVAAQACPMQATAQAQIATHDCCPDGAGKQDDGRDQDHQKSMAGCIIGQLCRTAPAISPSAAPLVLNAPALWVAQPITGDAGVAQTRISDFWRPPRSV